MDRKALTIVAVALVCFVGAQLFAPVAAWAADKAAITLKSGALTGKVATASGTAVEMATVKILDKDQQVVADLKTDKEGKFAVESLKAGTYTVSVAQKHSFGVVVADEGKTSNLVILLPGSKTYAAGQEGGMGGAQTGLLVGGGTAGVVGAGIVIHNSTDGGDGGKKEEPTPPRPSQ